MDRDRRYSHHRHHEHDRYQDIDIEEGLMDSTEQSLQDINRTSESEFYNFTCEKHYRVILWLSRTFIKFD